MRTTGSRIGAALACALVIAALTGWTAPMQAAAGDAKYLTYTELTAALERFLASPAINQRTHDDKTLILAIREENGCDEAG